MKIGAIGAGLLLAAVPTQAAIASDRIVATPAPRGEMPLYERATDAASVPSEEWVQTADDRLARNVTRPTLTPVLPDRAKATGAAVIIAPGGAFKILSMDVEGFAVARMLAARGIAAFVLKYRVNPTRRTPDGSLELAGASDAEALAVADGKAALRLVAGRAARWGVDPRRIGLLGFSAGAAVALLAGTDIGAGGGGGGARAAFIGYVYGGMDAVPVPADAPPLFVALAADDPWVDHGSFALVERWKAAGRRVELHYYGGGGYGFGMRRQGTTSDLWGEEFVRWLEACRLLRPGAKRP